SLSTLPGRPAATSARRASSQSKHCEFAMNPRLSSDCARLLTRCIEYPSHLPDLAFSPDNSTLATVGDDEQIRVLSLVSGEISEILRASERPQALGYTPDGSLLACCCERELIVWNVRARREKYRLDWQATEQPSGFAQKLHFGRSGDAVAITS